MLLHICPACRVGSCLQCWGERRPEKGRMGGSRCTCKHEGKRRKGNHIGAPAVFKLEQACQQINDAFGHFGCYVVGSALERPDWRDVDVRFILADDDFRTLFPDAQIWPDHGGTWEADPRWLLLSVAISEWLRAQTGLPIDFQFQPQTHANARHRGRRDAVGLRMAKPDKDNG